MGVLDVSIFLHSLAVASEEESGGEEALHPHRAPGMDAAG